MVEIWCNLPLTWRRLGSRMSVRTEPRSFIRNGRGVTLATLDEEASTTAADSGVCDIVDRVWHLATPLDEVTKERDRSSADWAGLFSSYFRPKWASPWLENRL